MEHSKDAILISCNSIFMLKCYRYPLEMHVVHFKSSYLSQEAALYEKDGVAVLVYILKVIINSLNFNFESLYLI